VAVVVLLAPASGVLLASIARLGSPARFEAHYRAASWPRGGRRFRYGTMDPWARCTGSYQHPDMAYAS
jgi:hypothetical protein